MKKVLLDTSAYSNLLKGDKEVKNQIEEVSTTYLSTVVIGELLTAFKNGRHEVNNRDVLRKFLSQPSVVVVHVTEETAEIYAHIAHNLKKKGTPIPTNDVWIAAHTVETGAKLITYDAHFLKVAGLRVWEGITN